MRRAAGSRDTPARTDRRHRLRGGWRDPDCIFCKIVAGELPATIVDEDERTIAFMDIAPATRGHALVIPRAHARDLLEIEREDLQRRRARRAAARRSARSERLGADGVNLLNSCGARRLADGLPLPHPRDPALRRAIRCACRGSPRRAIPRRSRPPRRNSRGRVAKYSNRYIRRSGVFNGT